MSYKCLISYILVNSNSCRFYKCKHDLCNNIQLLVIVLVIFFYKIKRVPADY